MSIVHSTPASDVRSAENFSTIFRRNTHQLACKKVKWLFKTQVFPTHYRSNYTVSPKTSHIFIVHIFAKFQPFFKIFSPMNFVEIGNKVINEYPTTH